MRADTLDDAVMACLTMHPGSTAWEIASTICGTVDPHLVRPRVYNSLARLRAAGRADSEGDGWHKTWVALGPSERVVLSSEDAWLAASMLRSIGGDRAATASRIASEIDEQLRRRR